MIDGLKVTMSGEELKGKLDERIESHARQAAHWARQLKAPGSDEGVPMPAHIVENEIERAHDQVETLTFIRDHIIGEETYRLGDTTCALRICCRTSIRWIVVALRATGIDEGKRSRVSSTIVIPSP